MTESNILNKTLTVEEDSSLKTTKKKQKKVYAWKPEGPRDPFIMLDALPEEKQQEIQKALHLFSLGQSLPKTLQDAKRRSYSFWNTQPVPQLGDIVTDHGPIAEERPKIREEPYSLPDGFCWDTLDLTRPAVLIELCTLLNENYMEEDDNTMRYAFSPEYMQWALMPPGWLGQWHCGLRVNANRKLVGFIAAVPANVCIYDIEKRVAQVKFLCVHKKLRLKRMSPVLIRELTRRVNRRGLYQAVYTAGAVLPTPRGTCRYWYRPLNPRKLMDVNHPSLKHNMTLQRAIKLYSLPEVSKTTGLRPMTQGDVPGVHSLLQGHLLRFQLHPILSTEEVEHWLLPRENVIDSYVVEGSDGILTDLVSFYDVSYSVLNHPIHRSLRSANLLYWVSTATNLTNIVEDVLVFAKMKSFDVFTTLDVMGNSCFLEKLKFAISDRSLHYYLFNWKCPNISPEKIGLLLPN